MTLEELIRECANEWGVVASEYIIRVQSDDEKGLHIYVRPSDRSGHTVDFIVNGNHLIELFNTKDYEKI